MANKMQDMATRWHDLAIIHVARHGKLDARHSVEKTWHGNYHANITWQLSARCKVEITWHGNNYMQHDMENHMHDKAIITCNLTWQIRCMTWHQMHYITMRWHDKTISTCGMTWQIRCKTWQKWVDIAIMTCSMWWTRYKTRQWNDVQTTPCEELFNQFAALFRPSNIYVVPFPFN